MRKNMMFLGFTLVLFVVVGCTGKSGSQTGPPPCPQSSPLSSPSDNESGPYPIEFRDIILKHINATFPSGHVQRNIVVRPPAAAWVDIDGQRLAGHVGHVDFSLKDEKRQQFQRVTFCYFLHKDAVLAFEDMDQAAWCGN